MLSKVHLKKGLVWVAACLLLSHPVFAATFTGTLVTNLPAIPGVAFDSSPSLGVVMGGYFYFAASDGPNGTTGRELWRTDGTLQGTTLVKDIRPGAGDSAPESLVVAGTNIYFLADDGVHGKELWKSDGTEAGTVMVMDFNPGAGDSGIGALQAVGTGLCFEISTNGTGLSNILYRTDGTADGTFVVAGPHGVATSSYVREVYVSGTDIAFVAVDNPGGFGQSMTNTLWRFGGDGPYLAYAVETLTNVIASPRIVGSSCYFITATNYTSISGGVTNKYDYQLLWRANFDTSQGPLQYVDQTWKNSGSYFSGLQVVNGYLFYSYTTVTGDLPDGPWQALGQSGSPVAVETLGTGVLPIIGVLGGYVYYTFVDPNTFDVSVRRTDGLSAGVEMFDFATVGLSPGDFEIVGSQFFFIDGGLGISDLTAAGTRYVDTSEYVINFLGSLGSKILYAASEPQHGLEPHISDGTTNGSILLKDIAPGTSIEAPLAAVAVGNTLFFTLDTPGLGVELWKSDGTAAGTTVVKDINPGTNSSSPSSLTAWNGLLYFTANDGTNGVELWRSDGTAAGTYMVKDVRPGAAGSNPSLLTPAGSQLFFVADDGAHGAELWRTDGTLAGTYLFQEIVPGLGSGNIRDIEVAGGNVYFIAGPTNTSDQLWFTAGTLGSAQFLYDFGNNSDGTTLPRHFTAYNGKVYFTYGSPLLPTLWVTDNTPSGTTLVSDSTGEQLAVAGGSLLVTAPAALWGSDGTANGTVVITNLPYYGIPGLTGPVVDQLTAVGTNIYFTYGTELWSSDGTTNGTVIAADFTTATNIQYSGIPNNLTAFQGALVFSAFTPLFGRELWGIAPGQGPAMVEDLSAGSGSANTLLICAGADRIFYFAKPDGQASWELRSLQLQSIAPPPETAYGGTPWPIPGLIQAVNFNNGGNGQGYFDTTPENEGGQYRPYEGVDIEVCDDTNGGFCVFRTEPGEWLDYTVSVAADGLYQLDIRMTSSVADVGYFNFELDGVWLLESGVFNNGTPGSWTTESIAGLALAAGTHKLRLNMEIANSAGDVGRFNWFNFTLLESNQPPVVAIQFPPSGGIVSTDQPITLVAAVNDPTTGSAPTVEFFMDGQSLGTNSAPPGTMSWTPTPGPHLVSAKATDSFGLSGTSSNTLFFVAEPSVVASGAFWRANASGTNLGTLWRRSTYDDSKWANVRSAIGFGYPDLRTVAPSNYNNSPIPTFYFRKSMSNDLSSFNYASITLTRDDAAVVYINGQELARMDLPAPPALITFTNLALTNVVNNATRTNAAVDIIPVPLSMLQNGTNVIAVEVHQGRTDLRENFDMKFDLSFSTVSYTPPPLLSISAVMNGVIVSWADSLTNWTLLQSADLTNWSAVTATVGDTNGLFNVVLPTGEESFYRLRQNGP